MAWGDATVMKSKIMKKTDELGGASCSAGTPGQCY